MTRLFRFFVYFTTSVTLCLSIIELNGDATQIEDQINRFLKNPTRIEIPFSETYEKGDLVKTSILETRRAVKNIKLDQKILKFLEGLKERILVQEKNLGFCHYVNGAGSQKKKEIEESRNRFIAILMDATHKANTKFFDENPLNHSEDAWIYLEDAVNSLSVILTNLTILGNSIILARQEFPRELFSEEEKKTIFDSLDNHIKAKMAHLTRLSEQINDFIPSELAEKLNEVESRFSQGISRQTLTQPILLKFTHSDYVEIGRCLCALGGCLFGCFVDCVKESAKECVGRMCGFSRDR